MVTDEDRRLLKRITASIADLWEAKDCARHILRLDLHSARDREDRSLLKCLNTALVVSYVRPFSGNACSEDVQGKLPPDYLNVLSDRQRRLHRELRTKRNQDQAHTDGRTLDMTVNLQQPTECAPFSLPWISGRNPIAPFSRETVGEIIELIDCLQGKLFEEQTRILDTLEEGESF